MPDPKLRVLFINDTSRNGGPGKTLLDILKFLDPARIHRSVLLPRPGMVSQRLLENGAVDELFFEPGLIENIFEPWSREIDRRDLAAPWPLKMLRAFGNVLRAAAALIRLTVRVRRARYDAIFCNGTMANFTGGLLAAFTGTPTVWHVLYTRVGSAARDTHERLARGKHVKAILCVSKPTSLQFGDLKKVRVLHDALDITEYDADAVQPLLRSEMGIDPNTIIFGSHGRILPRKGYLEFVRAARLVMDGLTPDERARSRFVVVGDTPQDVAEDHRAACEKLAAQLDVPVDFIGFRPNPVGYVRDFDVAIVPSIYQDPLPLAVLEAMALSKPVIAFDVGGMSEMIDNGVTGAIVPPGDIAAMARACLGYFHDAGLRQRHGAAGRQRIERDFNARIHAGVIQDLLGEIARR
jgi:glycosyltransferase involved in cell wall biosynthesis